MWLVRRTTILILQNICFSGEELTNNINGDESTIRNSEDKKEKTDLEIHMSTSIQEHKKVQNIRKRQNFLKATCSQGLYSYTYLVKVCMIKPSNPLSFREFLNFQIYC